MSKVYGGVLGVCWWLGVLTLAGVIVVRLLPALQLKIGISPRGGLLMAAILFLCVLATGEARKTPPSSS